MLRAWVGQALVWISVPKLARQYYRLLSTSEYDAKNDRLQIASVSVRLTGMPASKASSASSGAKSHPGGKHSGAKHKASAALPASKSPDLVAAATAPPTAADHGSNNSLASSSAAAPSHAVVPIHSPYPAAEQRCIGKTGPGVDLDNPSDRNQVQPQMGTVLIPNQQGVSIPAGPAPVVSQSGPQPALHPQPDPQPETAPQPHPQLATSPHAGPQSMPNPQGIGSDSPLLTKYYHVTECQSQLLNPQMTAPHQSLVPNPQLLQQSQTVASRVAGGAGAQTHPQTAATLLPFLPQLGDRQGVDPPHPSTAPAWAADHLQVLNQAQPEVQLPPDSAGGFAAPQAASAGPQVPWPAPQLTLVRPQIPSAASHGTHAGPRIPCAETPLAPSSSAAQSGMRPNLQHDAMQPTDGLQATNYQSAAPALSNQQQQQTPMPSPVGPSAEPQATAAARLALHTEDTQAGATAGPATVAAAVPATAAAEGPTAAGDAPTAAAQPPAAVLSSNTAAAHLSTAAAQGTPQAGLPLPTHRDVAAAPSVAVSIAADQPRTPITAQTSPEGNKDTARSGSPPGLGSALTTGQTQLASQDSDSPAASSLQGYLAVASPGSIFKLKPELRQDLRKATVMPAVAARALGASPPPSALPLEDPNPTCTPVTSTNPVEQEVLETLPVASDPDPAEAEAAETNAQPVLLHTIQLQASAADTGEESNVAAAVQQQPAGDSVGQLGKGWVQDPRVAATLKQFHDMRRDISEYASRLTDPDMQQKYADALAGKPVSPAHALTAEAYSSDDSSSDSDSDWDAEPDQDAGTALPAALAIVDHETRIVPLRHSSNRASTPKAPASASDAQPPRLAPRTLLQSPPRPGPHPAQPSTSRPRAMRSVGQLHSAQYSPLSQPARLDQASPSSTRPGPGRGPSLTSPGISLGPGLPEQATTGAELNQATNQAIGLTSRAATRKQQGGPALPNQATAVTRGNEQSTGTKRGGGSSDMHTPSLDPGTL